MKKKVLSMLMAAMIVSNCGIIAFAEEVEEVAVETSVEEAAPAEAVAEETAPVETEAVEIEEAVEITDEAVEATDEAVEVTDEAVEIADEEVALAGPETEADIEVEADEDAEIDEEITIEDEEVALAAIEEEHEHHFAYRSNGDQTHTKFCTDCDDEKEIVSCVDEDGDGICDICNGDLNVVMASQLKIEVHHFNNFVVTFDDAEYELEDGSYLECDETRFSDSIRGSFDELIAVAGVQDPESESELLYSSRVDYSIFKDLEGIEDVYAELSGEIPSNASIVIYEKDGVIEDYTIEMNDNYDPDKTFETVEEERTTIEGEEAIIKDGEAVIEDEETVIEDEETPLAGPVDEDSENQDTAESDDAIKPEDMEAVDTEDVEDENEETTDEIIEQVEDIVIETPSETVTVEAPVTNETVEVSEETAETTETAEDAE